MSLSRRYRQLAALIEKLESHGLDVQQAEPLGTCESDQSSDGGFVVQLCVELPADATADLFDVGRSEPVGTPRQLVAGPVGVKPATSASGIRLESEQPVTVSDGAAGLDNTETGAATGADGDDVEVTESRDDESGANARSEETDADDARTKTAEDGIELGEGSDNAASAGDEVSAVDEGSRDEETAGADDAPGADDAESTAEDADEETPGDAVPCTHPDCDRTFDTARGMKIHRTKAHPLSELVDGERERTLHRDPAVLARVYDEHDTFAEMTEALDVDVGAQAVRKQMIRHGIHEPGAQGSSGDVTAERAGDDRALDSASPASASDVDEAGEGDGADETRAVNETGDAEPDVELSSETDAPLADDTLVADRLPDLDLPGSLSTQDLLTAVEEANTLYDVQRALDLDQRTTRDVLTEYDLLELVSGRAAAVGDREELKAEIGQRIRRTAT